MGFRNQLRLSFGFALVCIVIAAALLEMVDLSSEMSVFVEVIFNVAVFFAFFAAIVFGALRYIGWRMFDPMGERHRLAGRSVPSFHRWMLNIDEDLNRLPWHD
jgi:hypothetical protein